ncbi:HU family DNA-binding protein [Mycoplasma phocoeninasale]|uniref:HU family DNA-binding protein n=1 Tax=Mycoplasma phocoeninasale TaxID=2726117 RepID=A0A858U107_9MOLU|nr:HU family DNA-binding protein [Mycoplasma phocoeninasale]QJG66130.1 HU family DNA-binding protein [Mycoplasma phocoeninasale]
MNKKELIVHVSEKTGFQQVLVETIFNEVITTITTEIVQGNNVSISGFGMFSSKFIPAKTKIHNITKVVLNIDAKLDPRFKFSAAYRERVDEEYNESNHQN